MITSMVYFGADHAGFSLKQLLIHYCNDLNIDSVDLGTNDAEPIDYPDIAEALCKNLQPGQYGVLICGTGTGMAIKANRFSYIRAALCYNVEYAKLAREHNDANVLVLGARFVNEDMAKQIFKTFFTTKFQGGRHLYRVQKL